MTSSYQVRIGTGMIPLLSLNELKEMSQTAMILGKFVNKPKSNSHWPIFLEKYF